MSAGICEAIVTLLKADAALATLVSTRVYPSPMPQACTKPAIAWQQISEPRFQSMDGPLTYREGRVQITAWAPTQAGSKPAGDAAEAALDGYAGNVDIATGDGTETVAIDHLFVEDATDVQEGGTPAQPTYLFGRRFDVIAAFHPAP